MLDRILTHIHVVFDWIRLLYPVEQVFTGWRGMSYTVLGHVAPFRVQKKCRTDKAFALLS